VKFEKDYSLASFLSTNKTSRIAWFLENGSFGHMSKSWDLFSSLMDSDMDLQVKICDDVKYEVKGEGTIAFQLKSRGLLDSENVLYVLCLKKNFLSILVMEERYFFVTI
jgi:hypothetical protein